MHRRSLGAFIASSMLALLSACSGGGSPTPGGAAADKKDAGAQDSLARVKKEGVLKWGADPSGGAPFVYVDEKDPDKIVGFEVEIMDKLAAHMGVKHEVVASDWDGLIAAMDRKSSDMVMNGIEVTPPREKEVLFTKPYYAYEQQLTVRGEDKDKYRTLGDLKGRKIATLKGAAANDVLKEAGWTDELIQPMPDSQTPYDELELKRVDAVLQESIIAAFYADPKRKPKVHNIPKTFNPGVYGAAFRKGDESLRNEVDRVLALMKENGELAEIYKRWDIWTEQQKSVGVCERKP